MKDRFEPARALFHTVWFTVVLLGAFLVGLYSGVEENVLYRFTRHIKTSVTESLALVGGEAWMALRAHPGHFLQPARHPGNGVTVNRVSGESNEFVFLAGFFDGGNELRLIRRDGTIVQRWPVTFSSLFPDTSHLQKAPSTDWNVDLHGALIMPDGSVVFNFETYGLVKLDRKGNTVWTLAEQTHHSVERAEGGGFWVPGRIFYEEGVQSPYPPFPPPFYADTLLRISEDGKVEREISLTEILYRNGLGALLSATGHWFQKNMEWDGEILHLNDIDELSSELAPAFSLFEPGDLALSIREENLVLILDPATEQVKWWRVGPWLRQHDPEFMPDGTLLVLNNNTYPSLATAGPEDVPSPGSNLIAYDFSTKSTRILYGDEKGEAFLTVIRGKVEPTPGGGLLVTEFEAGRVFEIDSERKIVWEFINRYDEDEVAEITEARVYPADYFTVDDW